MTAETYRARMRAGEVLVGLSAVVILLAGCGSSANQSQPGSSASSTSTSEQSATSSPSATQTPPPPPNASTRGKINAVSGSTVALVAKNGPTSVVIGPSTKVFSITPAQLTDVQNGSCVAISRTAPGPGAPPPAKAVTVSAPSTQGTCPQAVKDTAVSGKVTSAKATTISVDAGNGPTDVAVDPKTQYQKQEPVSALAITSGACLSASGPLGPNGTLEAVSARITPPANGACPGA